VKNLTSDGSVTAISAPFELISHEKAIVKLEAGCLWTYVLHDSERVGIAFAGPSQFTVDAITETNSGAVGSSVSGSLKGVQIYFGKADMEGVSGPASDNVISDRGYADAAAFLHSVNERCKI